MAVKRKTPASGKAKELGRFIVADPRICHGKPTFRGTRVTVDNVLELVAEGVPWDRIVLEFHDSFPQEAVAEAVQLARQAFSKRARRYGSVLHSQRKAS